MSEPQPPGEFLLYQTEDGQTRMQCRLEAETVWLSQDEMAELFQSNPQSVTLHLKAIYDENELSETATCKDYLQVRSEGDGSLSRPIRYSRLDAVLAAGFPRPQPPRYPGPALGQRAFARVPGEGLHHGRRAA